MSMARRSSVEKEVFNTRIRTDILRGAKALAAIQGKRFNDLFEEALVDVLRKHDREDLIPKDMKNWRLF